MRRWIVGLLITGALCTIEVREAPSASVEARKGIPLLFQHGDWTRYLAELPDTDDFQATIGPYTKYYDMGYSWSGVKILFIPVLHWDGTHCGYIDDDSLLEMSAEEVQTDCEIAGIAVPEGGVGFWWAWGGKLLFLALIGVGIAVRMQAVRRQQERRAAKIERDARRAATNPPADAVDDRPQAPVRQRRR